MPTQVQASLSHYLSLWRESVSCVEKLRHLPAREFHVEACRQLNVQFVIDSSKLLSWIFDVHRWAESSGLNVYNVFIWKDPVDL